MQASKKSSVSVGVPSFVLKITMCDGFVTGVIQCATPCLLGPRRPELFSAFFYSRGGHGLRSPHLNVYFFVADCFLLQKPSVRYLYVPCHSSFSCFLVATLPLTFTRSLL